MEIDLSEYKSPVQIIVNEMNTRLDGQILEATQSVGVDVNKEEKENVETTNRKRRVENVQ